VVSASGAAGAGGGAAGGSWLLAGPLGAKLAVACLLALGLGAGCIVLESGHGHAGAQPLAHDPRHAFDPRMGNGGLTGEYKLIGGTTRGMRSAVGSTPGRAVSPAMLTPLSAATHEFGPESSPVSGSRRSSTPSGARVATARARSSRSPSLLPAVAAGPAATTAAEREFAPG
jgi:hypothetical protein